MFFCTNVKPTTTAAATTTTTAAAATTTAKVAKLYLWRVQGYDQYNFFADLK